MKMKKLISALTASILAVSCFVSASAAENNLLTGGDFENVTTLTTLGDWKFPIKGVWYSGGTIETDEDTGNKYVSMHGTGLGQRVTVDEAGTYVMEIDVKVTQGTADISINNGEAAYPGTGSNILALNSIQENNGWETYKVEYTAAAGRTLMPYVWVNDLSQAYVDNVKLYKKPAFSYVGDVQTIVGTGDEANDKAYYGIAKNIDGTKFGFTVTGTYGGEAKSKEITWNNEGETQITGEMEVVFGVIIRDAATVNDLLVTYYKQEDSE